jgi:hypothetical protein
MAKNVLIIGNSGSGKSRSIVGLDPKETAIINVNGKDFPFKGWKSKYSIMTKDGGNLFNCKNSPNDYDDVIKSVRYFDEKRPEIKVIIIDDFQYLMVNEFMRRSKEKGYEKFNEIGEHPWKLIWDCQLCRQDLIIYFLAHSEVSESGNTKIKTIGKMLDEKVCLEGMFTICLGTKVEDGKYYFETQSTGQNPLKSPEGMFPLRIENDLKKVTELIRKYESEV